MKSKWTETRADGDAHLRFAKTTAGASTGVARDSRHAPVSTRIEHEAMPNDTRRTRRYQEHSRRKSDGTEDGKSDVGDVSDAGDASECERVRASYGAPAELTD